MKLYDRIINKALLTRRINISVNNLLNENEVKNNNYEQIDLFADYKKIEKQHNDEIKERKLQQSILDIKKKYGKNAILRAMNFEEGATTIDRNSQVGGHKG